jgi:hypothetical protein
MPATPHGASCLFPRFPIFSVACATRCSLLLLLLLLQMLTRMRSAGG